MSNFFGKRSSLINPFLIGFPFFLTIAGVLLAILWPRIGGSDWLVLAYVIGVLFGLVLMAFNDLSKFSRQDIIGLSFIAIVSVCVGYWALSGAVFAVKSFCTMLVFSLCFGLIYRDRILPRIDKFTVYYFTLIYWYYVFSERLYQGQSVIIVFAFTIPSVVAAVSVFRDYRMTKSRKVFNYIWYMALMAILCSLNLKWDCLYFFGDAEYAKQLTWPEMFLSGMAFNFFVVTLWNLYFMLPFTKSHLTLKNALEADKIFLDSKISNVQMPIRQEFFITLSLLMIFGANSYLKIVPGNAMGSIAIVVMPAIFTFIFLRKPVPQAGR